MAGFPIADATRILERPIFPELGARSIGDIRSHELLEVLKQIELKGQRYTALRAKQRCSRVFRYAVGVGYIERPLLWLSNSGPLCHSSISIWRT